MKSAIFILVFIIISIDLFGNEFKVDKSNSEMSVLGTSTLHDWEVTVENMYGYMRTDDSDIPAFVKFTCKSKSLQSGKSKMDDIMHDALNAEDHPEIEFKMKTITKEDDNYKAKGDLVINGQSREIDLEVKSNDKNGSMTFIGSKTFNMSLFNIDPPTALLGTIKTGDEITIKFSITFIRQS